MISADVQKILQIYGSKVKDYLKTKTLSVEDKKEIGKELYKILFLNKDDPKQETKAKPNLIPKVKPSLLDYKLNLINEVFKNIPIGISVYANEDLLPYVISSSTPARGVQWVQSHDKGMICLGVLNREEVKEEDIFNKILNEVIVSEETCHRGNIFLYEKDIRDSIVAGINCCIGYLESFDLTAIQIIHNIDDSLICNVPHKITRAEWMTEGMIAVIPENLSYLGDIFLLGRNHFAVSVHNINRGISICIPGKKVE